MDPFGVRERGDTGRIERDLERHPLAHGKVWQPPQLHGLDQAPAVRRVVGLGADLPQLLPRHGKGLRGQRRQHGDDQRAARHEPGESSATH
jgi:hypothetical protein